MKKIVFLLILTSFSIFSQKKHANLKKGFIAEGYDVVSYFNNNPKEGKDQFVKEISGVKFKFSSQENLTKFTENPNKYTPQYGGYCAYAIADKGKKVSINPETFEIREGKLYLFYNKGKINTLQFWIDEGAENLRKKADKNWEKISN